MLSSLLQALPVAPVPTGTKYDLGTILQFLFFFVVAATLIYHALLQTRRVRVSTVQEEATAWKNLAQARSEELSNLARRMTDMENRVTDLRRENEELRNLNITLQRENAELRHRVEELERLVRDRRELAEENNELRDEVRRLKTRVQEMEKASE